jgi:hypothetical protein
MPSTEAQDVRHASALALSRSSVSRILRSDLHDHLYKIQVAQELSERDFIARNAFCELFLTLVQGEPDVIRRMILSGEAHSELSGREKKQNTRYWSDNNPRQSHEKPLHSREVTVWCGVSASGIVGPYFFEDGNGLASYCDIRTMSRC